MVIEQQGGLVQMRSSITIQIEPIKEAVDYEYPDEQGCIQVNLFV